MKKWAYYNDNDERCCAWLRELIAAGHIMDGEVDCRPIQKVEPNDVKKFKRVGFFAGIGGWDKALQLAHWPDDREVWHGSCPCPPFSSAGKKKTCPECGTAKPYPCPWRTGYFTCSQCDYSWFADERHLWPEFWCLIAQCRPAIVFGEQVAADDGRVWLAGIRATLEAVGYGLGAVDTCSAGIGAPNLRQRLYWMAHAEHAERGPLDQCRDDGRDGQDNGRSEAHGLAGTCGEIHGMAHAESAGRQDHDVTRQSVVQPGIDGDGANGGLVESNSDGRNSGECASETVGYGNSTRSDDSNGRLVDPGSIGRGTVGHDHRGDVGTIAHADESGSGLEYAEGNGRNERLAGKAGLGFWRDSIWLSCLDGKTRRISPQPALFPLAPRLPGRMGLLRGSGNAINPQLAAQFILACEEARKEISNLAFLK